MQMPSEPSTQLERTEPVEPVEQIERVEGPSPAELSAVGEAARRYLRRGWQPLPVPHARKGPVLRGWERLRLTEADLPDHFDGPRNLGVLLGEPSGGLVDIDLDAPEAAELAASFLPATGARFGRPAKPGSHWLYRCDPVPSTRQYRDASGAMLVELRSSGAQTILPPRPTRAASRSAGSGMTDQRTWKLRRSPRPARGWRRPAYLRDTGRPRARATRRLTRSSAGCCGRAGRRTTSPPSSGPLHTPLATRRPPSAPPTCARPTAGWRQTAK